MRQGPRRLNVVSGKTLAEARRRRPMEPGSDQPTHGHLEPSKRLCEGPQKVNLPRCLLDEAMGASVTRLECLCLAGGGEGSSSSSLADGTKPS